MYINFDIIEIEHKSIKVANYRYNRHEFKVLLIKKLKIYSIETQKIYLI